MGRSRNLPAAGASMLLWVVFAVGCRGRARLTPADYLSELEFEKGRATAALKENLVYVRAATAEKRIAQEEKEAALEDLNRQEAAGRYLSEQVRKLSTERTERERMLMEAREGERKSKENREKLMEVATTSAEQLAELRQRVEAAARDRAKLFTENQGFGKQLELTSRELEEVKGELTRTRAVLRSLQENRSPKDRSAVEAALGLRIKELEASLAKAVAAREAPLEPRTGEAVPTAGASLLVAAAEPPVAVGPGGDPQAFWTSLVTLLKERWQSGLDGNYRWDSFGSAAVVITAMVVLFPILLFRFWRKTHRLRRQISQFQAIRRVEEEDEELDSEGLSVMPSPKAAPAAPSEESGGKASNRHAAYCSKEEERGFSAIIASPRLIKKPFVASPESPRRVAPSVAAGSADRPPPLEARPAQRPAERPPAPEPRFSSSIRPAAEPRPGLEPRKPIAAKAVDPLVLEPKRHVSAAGARPPAKPSAPPLPPVQVQRLTVDDDDDTKVVGKDEDMANTQIIPPLDEDDGPGQGKIPPVIKAEEGDKELLDELKDIINKKFDELAK